MPAMLQPPQSSPPKTCRRDMRHRRNDASSGGRRRLTRDPAGPIRSLWSARCFALDVGDRRLGTALGEQECIAMTDKNPAAAARDERDGHPRPFGRKVGPCSALSTVSPQRQCHPLTPLCQVSEC